MRTLLLAAALAADPWYAGDTARELAFAGLVAADVAQTRWALDRGWEELNPLLGRRPSRGRLLVAAGAGVVLHAGVAAILPRPWREGWQYVGIAAQGAVVGRGLVLGLGFRW